MTARIVAFLFLLSLLFTGCEKAKLKEPEPEPVVESGPKFPFFRDLTDAQGRVVNAEVLGRDAYRVTFVRWSDKRRFTVLMSSLSQADQDYLQSFPVFTPRPPDPERTYSPQRDSKRPKKDDGPLQGIAGIIQERIEEKEKEIKAVREEALNTNPGSIRSRTLANRLRKLEEELQELGRELHANR